MTTTIQPHTAARRGIGVLTAALAAIAGTVALTSTPAHAAGDGKVTSDGPLTVRYAPSRHSSDVGKIRAGKTIPLSCWVTGTSVEGNRTWYQLPGDGGPEFVSAHYVKTTGSKPQRCSGGKQKTIKAAAELNVRRGPNTADKTIGTLDKGEKSKVICKVHGNSVDGNKVWYLLPGSNWVSARYADNVDGAPGWCVER